MTITPAQEAELRSRADADAGADLDKALRHLLADVVTILNPSGSHALSVGSSN